MNSADERNFRSQYYGKVGFRRGDEKRSLEPLLGEVPVDAGRLAQAVRTALQLPAMYRPLVWKLLLKVQPCHPEAAEFVTARRRETCDDTEHMLRLLGHVTDDTPPALVHWLGWLLNSGRLVTMDAAQIDDQSSAPQLQVAELVADLFDGAAERCWVSWRLWTLAAGALKLLPGQLPWLTAQLEREQPALAAHLSQLGVLSAERDSPLRHWAERLFCGILPGSSVERLVDRLVAGAERILPLTAVSLLLTHSRALMACTDPADARRLLLHVQPEDTDRVFNWALDSWTKLNKV
ncbi:TBC1 domain family member 7 [Amphibalanus amphitrite]|uniref:TBC1 domain family member 7 n=1 Tax=Amphibalanus amphitrite TaxID=1232801 RepID=A0A6A4W4X0_AMPAM|nr:TBC1 domain family member 7 [Amphibalanus amphitrite]